MASFCGYTSRFQKDLAQPGLRIPLTGEVKLFFKAADLGRRVIWLHTFGERFVDPKADRPAGPPRLPKERQPKIPKAGKIPDDLESMPDEIGYDINKQRLLVGTGFIENVPPEVWNYEVSGKRVLNSWFSYRKKNRERPIIGDRRPPSKLGEIQADHWLSEYTTELLDVLNVLTMLVELEPEQAKLLEAICDGPTISLSPDHRPAASRRRGSDCPEWMRKSLGPPPKQTRNLFSDLSDEDHVLTDETNEEDCEDQGEDEA